MTKPNHTGALKLVIIIVTVLLVHSGAFSESARLWYVVSPINSYSSSGRVVQGSKKLSDDMLQIKCPENISTYTDINECSADISNIQLVQALNGTIAKLTWTMEGATEGNSKPYGINQIDHYVFNEGVTIIRYLGVDYAGNTSECSFTVVVSDNQAPQMSAPKSISINCDERIPSPHTTLQAFLNAGGKASDNCNLNPNTFKLESEHKSNQGCPFTLTRTYQISDWHGNITKVKQNISVEEMKIEMEVRSEEFQVLTLKSGMGIITSTTTGGDWNNGTSWEGGVAPLPGDDVIIVNGATISLTGNEICNDITINGTVICGSNTLQVDGNWENNGTFNAGSGTVEFAGTSIATISGSSSTAFYNVVINKGSDITSFIEANGTGALSNTGTLTILNGLFKMTTGTFQFKGNSLVTIPTTGGIWVNGAILNSISTSINGFSIENNGLIKVSLGTLIVGTASGNSSVTRSDGTLEVTGGTINVAGRLEVSGGTADISGGTINLNTVGQNSSTKGTLDLSVNSDFTMSNGVINFLNPNGTGNFDVIMLNGVGGSKTFTGGVFNFGDGTADTYKISSAVPFPAISSDANTNLEYKLLLNSTGTINFPLVDNLGNAIPATVQINGGSVAPGAFMEIKTTGTKYFENKNSNNYLKRYWTVSTSGVSNYDITASYANGDIVGTESEIVMAGWFGSLPWIKYDDANTLLNTVTATGISASNLVFAGIAMDLPTVIITPTISSICIGSSTTLNADADGDPTLTYSWTSNPVGYTSGSQNITVSPTATTTYTVIVTDGNGFTATDDITITVIPDNTISLNSGNNIQTVCINTAIENITYTSTGATGATFSGLPTGVNGIYSDGNITISGAPAVSGTFNYTVTLTGGCGTANSTGTITVTPNNTINLTSGNNVQTRCINAAIANITYTSTGATGATFSGLPAGVVGNYLAGNITISGTPTVSGTFNYSVNLTEGCGNVSGNGTITVTPENTITLSSAEGTNVQQVCVSRNIANITYNTTGASGATVTGLPAGVNGTFSSNKVTISGNVSTVGTFNYIVTLTGGCGNITENGTITVNPNNSYTLTSGFLTDVQTICINTSITNITYSTTGATGATFTDLPDGVTGNWNSNVITISGTPTESGNFNYRVALTGGCGTLEIPGSIRITPPVTASALITDQIKCFGGTATIKITASGGTPPYTFSFQGKTPSTTGIFTFVPGSETGIEYNWSVTDSKNCTPATGTITVTQPLQLSATASTTNVNCNGGTTTVTITATGGKSPYSFTFNGITNSSGIFTNVVAGVNIPWSVKDANNCPTPTETLTIDQPAPISIISATVTTPISCLGGTGTVTIVGSGGTGQLFYTFNGETNTSGVFTGVYAGNNLSFSITDENNCTPKFGTVNVTQPAAMSATAVASPATCFGTATGSINLTVTGGTAPYSFAWNNGAGTDEDPVNLAAGTYSVMVTDFNGCPATASATVAQPIKLRALVSETTSITCDGETATIKITASGGTGTKTYTFQGQPDNTNGIFAGITGVVAPGIPYNWSVTDVNGCDTSGIWNVVQPEQIVPGLTFSNSPICLGATLNLTTANASGGTSPYRYSWTGPNGFTANNSQNPTILNATSAASGTYTLTVTDANNCTNSTTTDVTVHPATTMDDPANLIYCHDDAVPSVIFSGAESYTWTNSNTEIGLPSNGNGNTLPFTATNTTNAPVTATITVTSTQNGCLGAAQTFTITVNPKPVVEIYNNTPLICINDFANLTLSSNVINTTFEWSFSTGGLGNGGALISEQLSSAGSFDYIVTPVANGCYGDPVSTTVVVISDDYDIEVITSGPNNEFFCVGDPLSISFGGNSGAGGFFNQWEWRTHFTWSVSNSNIHTPTTNSSPEYISNLGFNVQNITNVTQTAIITITPWAYRRTKTWFTEWTAWNQICSGNPYSFSITVSPFAITCPTDIVTTVDAGQCYATITQPTPDLTCGTGANITWSAPGATPSSGSGGLTNVQFPTGLPTTVTYTATIAGTPDIIRTCSFTVTVTDDELPEITCPDDINVNTDLDECEAVVNYSVPVGIDNCSGWSTQLTTGLGSGSSFPIGTTTETYSVIDAAGNISTCSFNISVTDAEAPVLSACPGNQTECAPAGGTYVNTKPWDVTATDNCQTNVNPTYTLKDESDNVIGTGTSLNNVEFNVGVTTVTWTSTDNIGNSSSCSFTVTVDEGPAITLNPISQDLCLGGAATFTVAASGNPAPTFQWRKNGIDIPGATGATLIIDPIAATDAGSYDAVATGCNFSATSSAAILSVSTIPIITQQPANQTDCFGQSVEFTVAATGGNLPYTYAWEIKRLGDPGFTDASVVPNITFNNGLMTVNYIGNADNPDQTQYRVTVTDACGNSTALSSPATLTVNQMEPKTLVSEAICQDGIITFTAATLGSSPVGYVWQLNGSTISNGGSYSGATSQTLTISNAQAAQNGIYSASAIFNITLPNNNEPGATTCQTGFIDVGELIFDEGPEVVASPASQTICSGGLITEIVLSDNNGAPGPITYSWVRDNTTVLTGIAASGTGNIIGSLTSLDPSNSHTTIFTVTASTINGCTSTTQVSVTVEDNEAPTVDFCPGDFTVSTGADICGAVVNYTAPTFNDNCDGNGLAGTLVSGPESGDEFPPGPTTVTWEYTDGAGNGPVTCSFVVTVNDDVDPTALCQNITVQLDATGNVAITADQIDNGSSDPCGAVTLSVDKTTFDCDNVGINTVILTVEDVNGNSATCTATVTVEDNIEPTALCKDITVQLDASGNATIAAADIDNGSGDNCGTVTLTAAPTTFTCTNVGDNTVVLTVTDENGGNKTCNATVTVKDNIAPTVLCKDFTVQLDGSGNATITVNDIDNGSTDNCAIDTRVLSKTDFTCADAGPNNVTLTVTDVNGNSESCSATVTVEDTENPVALCQNITVQLDAAGNATITAADIDNGSTDNCGTPSLSVDISTFNCTNIGPNTVTLTVTDGSGNSHTCAAIVTVKDDNFPVTISAAPTQTSIDCYGGTATVTIAVTGGVGVLTYTFNGVSNNNGIFSNIIAGTYNWSVTNSLGCGNTSGTYVVQQAGDLSATVALTDVTCSSGADGTITVTNSSGGSGNYEYSNNGGSTWQSSNVFSGLIPGSYNVQIRDAAVPTCLKILDANVVIFTLTANVSFTDINCNSNNNGTITVSNPFGGSGSYNYSIDGGTTWSPNGTFVNLAPGTYNVQIQDANDITCIVELNNAVVITEPDLLSADVGLIQISCFGANNGSITVSNPQGGYGTYQVSINGSNWFTISAATSYTFTNLSPNSYTVMIRDASVISCILNLTPSVINEPSVLSATINHTNVSCFGFNDGVINVTAPQGGNGTYQVSINGTDWFNVSAAVPYAFNNLVPGTYTVQIRDAAQPLCSVTITPDIIITEPPLVTVNDPGPQDFCNVASTTPINLTGSPVGVVFDITGGTGIGLADQIGVSQIPSFATIPGTATVTITPRANGCAGTPVTVIFNVFPIPTANLPVDVIFCNNVLSDPFPLTGTPANVVFDITGGASIGLPNATNVTAIPPFTPITGTATVTITPKVGNNCTGTPVSFPVTVRPTLTASISGGGAIVCRNSVPPTITFNNPMALPVEILYNINGGADLSINVAANSSFPIFTPTNVAGTFSYNLVGVKYQTKPDCFFNITGSAVVTVLETPLASISGTNTVCQDAASPLLTFTNPINSMVRVTYNVNGLNPATIDVPALSTATFSAPTSVPGTFVYNLVSAEFPVNPSCSNIITGSATITVLPKPTVTIAGNATVCKNATAVNVTITNPQILPVRITYTVNNGTPVTANIGAGLSTVISVNTANPGSFIYKVTSVQYIAPSPDCVNNVDISATVVVLAPPTASIGGNATVCLNAVQPVITFTNPQAIPVTVTYNINGAIQPPVDVLANSTATVSAPTSTAGIFVYNLVSIVYQGGNTCTNNITGSVTITVRPVPTVSISGNATVCQFASPSPNVTTTNPMNLPVTVTYRRNGVNQAPVNIPASSPIQIPVPTATLTNYLYELVSVQFQTAPNCPGTATGSVTVNILAAPTVTVSGSATVCPNAPEPVITFANPQALPINVTYNINGIIQPVLNIGANGTATISAPTATSGIFNYNVVSVEYQGGAACANTTSGAFATITVKNAPATPVAGNNGPVCVGSPLSLTANTIAGATYSWTGPNGFTSSLQNPTVSANATSTMAGIYSVTATVGGCISPEGTTTVVVNEVPAAPLAGNNGPVCIGSNLSLTAGNITGAAYNWTGPNGFTSNVQNPTVSASATMAMVGTYTVTATVNGCISLPATTDVSLIQSPVISSQSVTICNGDPFSIMPVDGNPIGTIVPAGTTYSWTVTGTGFTGGSAQNNQVSIGQTLTLTNANVGATATYTVTPRANGCDGTPFTVVVTITPKPRAINVSWWQFDYNDDYWEQCAGQSGEQIQNDLDVWIRNASNTGWVIATTSPPTFTGTFGWEYSFNDLNSWGPSTGTVGVNYQHVMPPAPSVFTRLGTHYFRFYNTVNGCTVYSDVITMVMTSTLIVDPGESLNADCNPTPGPIQLVNSSVTGTPSPQGAWSIESLDPLNGGLNGSLSSTAYTANPSNVTYTPPANYTGTVTLRLTSNDPDGSGSCAPTYDFRTITISAAAGASAGNPQTVCAGGSVILDGSVYGTATGGTWSAPSGSFSNVNSLTSTYTPAISSGTVTLTLTPNVSGSCVEPSTVVITVNPAAETEGVTICAGGSGTLSASGCPSFPSTSAGSRYAGEGSTGEGTGTNWTNANYIVSNNTQYATVNLSRNADSENLNATNFGFNIPAIATINGIIVSINRWGSSTFNNGIRDVAVQLLGGSGAGENKAITGSNWSTNTSTVQPYGGVNDTWLNTWTPAQINAPGFGVTLDVRNANGSSNRTATVDYITIEVFFTVAGTINWYTSTSAVTPIGTGSPFNPVGVTGSGLPNTNTPGTTTFYVECTTYPGCRAPVEFVINPKPTVTKPNDLSESACSYANQAALDAAFATWLTGFSVSGGAAPVGSFAGSPTAPALCTGGAVTVVYNYTDDCETGSVSATFTVTPPPALTINTPGDDNSFSCDYINQAAVQTAFTNWLAGFTITGGCAPVGTFTGGIPAAPPICGGSVTVTYNVSDLCESGTETATFTVSGTASVVLDTPDPKVAPACDFTDQVALDADFANWLSGFAVVSGGCAGSASYGFPVAPALCTGGTTEVTYLYQDVCATVAVTQTYTINAPGEIVINKPVDFNENICDFADQAAVDAAFASWLTGFSATGGCGGGTGTFSTTVAPALCGSGTVDVTYTYTDNCQSKSETASFTLNNTNSLVINKPANVDDEACFYGSQEDLNTFFADWLTGFGISGGCGATGSYGSPSAPDLCAGGTTTVTYTVTDNCGNIFTETATFKISIQGDLTFVKPEPFTAAPCNYANQNELNLAFQNWLTGFGVSGGCRPVGSYGNPVAPNLCEGGTVTVIYEATDVCLTSSVSQTFTVEPVEPIQAVQMEEHFAPPCLSQTEMDAEFAAWISTFAYTGGCNVNPPSLEAFTAPPACGGSVIVAYTFYDNCGQTATGSAVFTVEPDEEDPVVTCPADFTGVLIDNGSCLATLDLIPPVATDNCSAFGAITFTNNAPAQFPVGTTIVTWTATDICGNSSTCEQLINVLDNDEAPVITNCPNNAEDIIIGAGCSMVTGEITEPTITDNCPNPVLHYDIVYPDGSTASGIGSVSGLAFPVGVSTVTYTAIDDAGNPSLPCTFTVWIKDLVPPEFEVTCPIISITVNAAAGVCNAFVNVPGPSVSDPCDELVTLSHNSPYSINTTNADGTYPVGTTTVIWTATDLSGNTITCAQEIIVKDVTAPSFITCAEDVSGFSDESECVATGVDIGTPTATDDCSAPVTFTNDAPAEFPVGNTTITWTATDAAGNTATCTQIVTITDNNQPPVFTFCPPNQEQTTTANNCELIDIVIPNPEYDDNCGVTVLTWTIQDPDLSIRNSNPTGINYVTGETFFVGVSTVTYIAYDAAGNPSEPCTFTVWIKDFVKPIFTAGCPPNVGPVPTDAGVCTATITVPTPLVSDPCGEGYTLTNNYTGDYKFPIGVTTITWTIVDASGNITTCDQTITVIESQILAVDCPADIVRSVAPGDDFVSGIVVGNPTTHLSCFDSELTWVMVPPVGYESMYTPAQLSGNDIFVGTGTYYLGVTTVTYTLTDENGTSATCDFTITITTAPEIQCADDETFDADENCEYPFDPGVPTLIQGIPPIDWTWTLTNPDGSTLTGGSRTPDDGLVPLPVVAAAPHEYPFRIGITTIDWTATNIYGTATCTQTITVTDNEPPTFNVPIPFESCVEMLYDVVYTTDLNRYLDHNNVAPNPYPIDNGPIEDFYLFRRGNPGLDLDLTALAYTDNCCDMNDGYSIEWTITFDAATPNGLGGTSISGTGQPSSHPTDIKLWGDRVNHQTLNHTITYRITDCNENISDPVIREIIIKPRPKITKTP